MNSSTFAGNLAADPVLRTSADGKNRATFTVAVDEGPDDKRVTHWISVTAFGKLGENVVASLKKGQRVIVVGRFSSNTRSLGVPNDQGIYEAKNITDLTVIARSVGPDLQWQTAVVSKVVSNGNQAPQGQPVQQYAPQGQPVQQYAPQAPQGQPVYQQPVQQYAPQAPQGQPVYQPAPQGQPVQQYAPQAPQGQPVYQPVAVPNLAVNDF